MKSDAVTRFLIVAVVLGSWASVNYGLFFGHVSIASHLEPLAQRALGLLDALTILVIGYYFATNSSSNKKTDLLAKAPPVLETEAK